MRRYDVASGTSGLHQVCEMVDWLCSTSERIKKNLKSYAFSTSLKPINTLRGKGAAVTQQEMGTTFSPVTCVGLGTEGHPLPSVTWPVNRFTNLMRSGGSERNLVSSQSVSSVFDLLFHFFSLKEVFTSGHHKVNFF